MQENSDRSRAACHCCLLQLVGIVFGILFHDTTGRSGFCPSFDTNYYEVTKSGGTETTVKTGK